MKNKSIGMFCALFGFTLIVQSVHMLEHIVQVYQYAIGVDPAHGLIGQFDLESVHFFYDFLFTLGFWLILQRLPEEAKDSSKFLYNLLVFGVVVQSYHMVEHIIKYYQYIQTGMQGTPGFLGNHINLILFHFTLNLIGTVILWVIYIGLKFHRTCSAESKSFSMDKQEMTPPAQM
ncbi:MAG: hypothetical protein Q8Q94_00350 [bacterium]|nr:hypothetical protein [bacterium]